MAQYSDVNYAGPSRLAVRITFVSLGVSIVTSLLGHGTGGIAPLCLLVAFIFAQGYCAYCVPKADRRFHWLFRLWLSGLAAAAVFLDTSTIGLRTVSYDFKGGSLYAVVGAITAISLLTVVDEVCGYLFWRTREVREVYRCSHCGYDLRGLRRRDCPECGTVIIPTLRNLPPPSSDGDDAKV